MTTMTELSLAEVREVLESDVYAACPDVMERMWEEFRIDWDIDHLILRVDKLEVK